MAIGNLLIVEGANGEIAIKASDSEVHTVLSRMLKGIELVSNTYLTLETRRELFLSLAKEFQKKSNDCEFGLSFFSETPKA